MGTRSVIAPMCILVKDHSRVLCEQLQQLRLQTGLVDLDIVCEDHHINVHKVVMAACSKFFKDQLCKVNVQVPVILRLEDFGLELKRDAVSYIIEFVYRGEVNIPGERLTDVCAAAHTLGVVGLEHLPVPAAPQRPPLLSKDHLQIADESELRGDENSSTNVYNSFLQHQANLVQSPSGGGQTHQSMGKLAMDINSLNVNPFFNMNNQQQQHENDDIILLQTADDPGASRLNSDPDIIPISFGDTGVTGGSHHHEMANQRLYHHHGQLQQHHDKINLIVSEGGSLPGEQYRIIPEILPDGTFHEETIDSCLSLFPNSQQQTLEPQDLSPVKTQDNGGAMSKMHNPASQNRGKNITNSGQGHHHQDLAMAITGNQTSFQALFEAASNELVSGDLAKTVAGSSSNIVFSTPSTHVTTICSNPSRPPNSGSQKPLPQIKPADCAMVDSKHTSSKHSPATSPGKSMSQGKLRVINQGIQSENIQTPSLADQRNKARRRSGQVLPGHHAHLPGQVAHLPGQLTHIPGQAVNFHNNQACPTQGAVVGPGPSGQQVVGGQATLQTSPSSAIVGPGRSAGVRLLSVGPQDNSQDSDQNQIVEQGQSESEMSDVESAPSPGQRDRGLATPGLVPWAGEEMWRGVTTAGNSSWTHPVESVDTSVPTSGAVWQLPASQEAVTKVAGSPGSGPGGWVPTINPVETARVLQDPGLSLMPAGPVGPPRAPPPIPWNTPVINDNSREAPKWEAGGGLPASGVATISTSSVQAGSARDTPPSVSVSWTQPQASACPSPALGGKTPSQVGVVNQVGLQQHLAQGVVGTEVDLNSSSTSPNMEEVGALQAPGLEHVTQGPGPSWRNNFGDDNMLAIRSGIPLALQNKAIRSGVPIGPFQNKRKRKSRASQDGSKAKKRPSVGGKKGDLEVRKDLTIESQRHAEEIPIDNVFQNDDSRPSTSNIVSKTKEESSISLDANEVGIGSPIGGVHIKTVKKLNSGVVADMDLGQGGIEISSADLGESSKADKFQFSCVNCSMMFSSASQLKRHTQHAHGKEETLFCQVCPERCHGKENLKLHLYKTHGIGEMFRCEECNYESAMKAGYIKHLSEHIPQEDKKKKCPKCDKVFKTKTGLNMHLKQHFDESLFSCLVCDFKTPQKLNLVKHMASKHGQDVDGRLLQLNISCELCDFKCIAEHMLKNHNLRKHTQKSAMRFHCTACNYASVEKAALDKHMRFKHTNERPFMCETCGFSTHTASAMARHKRSHSNSKPHKCDVCGHEYADKKRLRDHMYIHSDQKPFRCELCSYTCTRKDNLTAHLRKQHSVSKLEKWEGLTQDESGTQEAPDSTSCPVTDCWRQVSPQEEGHQTPDLEPPKPSWSAVETMPRATSSPISGLHPGLPIPSSLPTIAMADIAVPYSHSVDIADQVQGGGWVANTRNLDQEEVIFVTTQDHQLNTSN